MHGGCGVTLPAPSKPPDLFIIQQHPVMLGRSSGQWVLAPACPTAPFLPPSFPSTTASCELSSSWHLSTFRDASGTARAISGHCCSWKGPCQWSSSQQAPSSLSGASDPGHPSHACLPSFLPSFPVLLLPKARSAERVFVSSQGTAGHGPFSQL